MRKTIVFLAVLLLAAAALSAQDVTLLKVKVQAANVRVQPEMTSAVIKMIGLGTQLESRRKVGDWYEVRIVDAEGKAAIGYISGSVVDVVAPAGSQPAPAAKQPPIVKPAPETKPAAEPPGRPETPSQAGPAAPAKAPRARPSAMILGRYGTFAPSDAIFKEVYGSGSVMGGELRFRLSGGFSLSLNGGYFKKKGALTVTGDETTMTMFPLEAMLVYHVLSGSLMPYVGAGGAFCRYTEENAIGKVEGWGTGFAVCGGVTFRLGPLGLDARAKYTSMKIKPLEDEANLGGLTLSVGAGFVF